MIRLKGLYVVTYPLLESGKPLSQRRLKQFLSDIETALMGGATMLQFRDKSSDAAQRFQLATALQQLCSTHHIPLIINDDVDLALAVNAQGVHLGQDDMNPIDAREILGNDAIIGLSCYNQLNLAQKAQQDGANYVALGRFFSSSTKPDAVQADINLIAQVKAHINIPVVAIGGINTLNAKLLVDAGADMLAVLGGVFDQSDILSAAKAIAALYT